MAVLKGTLDVLVLKTLSWGPMHGFEIISWLETAPAAGSASPTPRCCRRSIASRRADCSPRNGASPKNERRARYYKLTPAGREQLRAESAALIDQFDAMSAVLTARSALSDRCATTTSPASAASSGFRFAPKHRSKPTRTKSFARFSPSASTISWRAACRHVTRAPKPSADSARRSTMPPPPFTLPPPRGNDACTPRHVRRSEAGPAYAIRTLRRDVGFTAFAVAIVALGIGASATVFSVASALLLRPLPFTEPDRLTWIQNGADPGLSTQTAQVNPYLSFVVRINRSPDVAGYFAFYGVGDMKLTTGGDAMRVSAVPVTQTSSRCSASTRLRTPVHARRSAWKGPQAVLLSHALWQRRFESDPASSGRRSAQSASRRP